MREFRCAYLGNRCSWKHVATEELLADMAALHLREAHGIQAVDPEMLSRIKNSFSKPSPDDIPEEGEHELKEYICELGPACSWRYLAMTEDLIVDGAAVHAREAHGVREFTPEMMARVKQATRPWGGTVNKAAA